MKPILFIGSSTESVKIAYAIQENLEHDALCKVWTQGIFQLSGNTLDNLLNAVTECEFAVFVFQPDDISQIRDQTVRTVRDNVIFELGLFIGGIGKERVFFLVPKGSEEIHLPTDLIGITPGHYEPPEKGEDLLSAIGPFCNKVRRQIESIWPTKKNKVRLVEFAPQSIEEQSEKISEKQPEVQEVENGVTLDAFGNFTISIAPTVFWANRISSAFPGIRGLHWFADAADILNRLQILLKKPIYFDKNIGHGTTCDPIWWWRGGSCLQIMEFSRLNDTRCLMDIKELEIDRIAVYRSIAYYASFIYVEVKADQPTGLYPSDEATIQERIKEFGYVCDEYALFQDTMITRECYDDGAAVINGVPMDISGAELRIRYLSKYNFLIAPKFSPINSKKFDRISKKLLDEMLLGQDHIDTLCTIIDGLPRHDNDD